MNTKSTKNAARQAGRRLITKMNSKGWKLRVWENMGWHYSIRKGAVTLYETIYMSGEKVYDTLMSSSTPGAGEMYYDPRQKNFTDPNEAYFHQLRVASNHARECLEDIKQSL